MPNRLLQGKSPPSSVSWAQGSVWAGFPLNVGDSGNALLDLQVIDFARNIKGSFVMRIVCPHCNGKARITSRASHTPTAADLYAVCLSPSCGASFVYGLGLKHTINPPVTTTAELAAAVLRALPPAERAKLGAIPDLFAA